MTKRSAVTPLTLLDGGPAEGSPPLSDTLRVSPDLVMLSQPETVAAESIRQLRTRITAQHLDRGRRSLVFCAPQAESGCSYVAANVAIAFAQTGVRVLLVNADMRGEGLDAMFGDAARGPGLRDYLSDDRMASNSVIVSDVLPAFSLMPSGGPAPDAQELLSTSRFEALFNNCLRQFDLTIVDTPPANRFADAHAVARAAGFAVIVGRSNRTYFSDVSELSRQLQADGVSIVGTVLHQS